MTELTKQPFTIPVQGDVLMLVREISGVPTIFQMKPEALQLSYLNGFDIGPDGMLRKITEPVGTLPEDFTINNGIYMLGTSPPPAGLSSNHGIIMTDGSVYYPNTIDNGGVLCATAE
ncbi:hypothetical protein [Gluconobacter kondonii]|uniref:hypothetical protein n=1 Tax=Gluconobacter kondonii TaxID=941463 RepID=UPI001B8B2F24|nr:hypothetical protein [Gluconobacter kondonii]MBS1056106.1 hypothetical protein [Gluconobacter kondonii]